MPCPEGIAKILFVLFRRIFFVTIKIFTEEKKNKKTTKSLLPKAWNRTFV